MAVLEADGHSRVYYRVNDENIVAHPLMVSAWTEAEKGGTFLSFSNIESQLINLLADRSLSSRQLALELHCSQSMADDLVVRLASAGVLKFVYEHGEFRISAV